MHYELNLPETGVEPVYPKGCQILSLVRLPFRHSGMLSNVYPMSIKTSATSQKPFITPSYKLSISTQRAFRSIEQKSISQIFGNPSFSYQLKTIITKVDICEAFMSFVNVLRQTSVSFLRLSSFLVAFYTTK